MLRDYPAFLDDILYPKTQSILRYYQQIHKQFEYGYLMKNRDKNTTVQVRIALISEFPLYNHHDDENHIQIYLNSQGDIFRYIYKDDVNDDDFIRPTKIVIPEKLKFMRNIFIGTSNENSMNFLIRCNIGITQSNTIVLIKMSVPKSLNIFNRDLLTNITYSCQLQWSCPIIYMFEATIFNSMALGFVDIEGVVGLCEYKDDRIVITKIQSFTKDQIQLLCSGKISLNVDVPKSRCRPKYLFNSNVPIDVSIYNLHTKYHFYGLGSLDEKGNYFTKANLCDMSYITQVIFRRYRRGDCDKETVYNYSIRYSKKDNRYKISPIRDKSGWLW